MSRETQFVVEVWAAMRDVVPANKRSDVASGIMHACMEYGFDAKELCDLMDEDNDLHNAFLEVFGDDLDDNAEDGDE